MCAPTVCSESAGSGVVLVARGPRSATRVFDLRWGWVKELRDSGRVTAVKVRTESNVADIHLLTKCLNAGTVRVLVECVRRRSAEMADNQCYSSEIESVKGVTKTGRVTQRGG